MDIKDIRIYNEELKIDGTMEELLDWSYRYDKDYSDEALDEISAKAKEFGFPKKKYEIPILVKKSRNREAKNDGTLPYESMKLDKLIYGKISFSETKEYGEVEIMEEQDKVIISVVGRDDEGFFTAAGAYSVEEFMEGEDNWLETAVGAVLYYSKVYED